MIPKCLKTRLFNYQLECLKWAEEVERDNVGGIIADDMGIGKTIEALSIALRSFDPHGNKQKSILIAAPLNAISVWQKQIEHHFLSPEQGGPRVCICTRDTKYAFDCAANIIITNHDTIRVAFQKHVPYAEDLCSFSYNNVHRLRDLMEQPCYKKYFGELPEGKQRYHIFPFPIVPVCAGMPEATFFSKRWDTLIVDEGHEFRGPDIKRLKAINSIVFNKCWFLSGTPIHNSITDVLSALMIVRCKQLPPLHKWLEIASKHNSQPHYIKTILDPLMLRRKKEDVCNGSNSHKRSPQLGKKFIYLYVTPFEHDEERRAYRICLDNMRDEAKNLIDSRKKYRKKINASSNEARPTQGSLFATQMNCRLACIAASTVKKLAGSVSGDWAGKDSTKMRILKRMLLQNSNEKCVVLSSFVCVLEIAAAVCDDVRASYIKITGEDRSRRDEAIHLFQTDATIKVALLSLKAGGVAIDLSAATRLFVLDPWWNRAAEEQAFDRIHRIGQQSNVKITYFLIANTIEKVVFDIAKKKGELAAEILEGRKRKKRDEINPNTAAGILKIIEKAASESNDSLYDEEALHMEHMHKVDALRQRAKITKDWLRNNCIGFENGGCFFGRKEVEDACFLPQGTQLLEAVVECEDGKSSFDSYPERGRGLDLSKVVYCMFENINHAFCNRQLEVTSSDIRLQEDRCVDLKNQLELLKNLWATAEKTEVHNLTSRFHVQTLKTNTELVRNKLKAAVSELEKLKERAVVDWKEWKKHLNAAIVMKRLLRHSDWFYSSADAVVVNKYGDVVGLSEADSEINGCIELDIELLMPWCSGRQNIYFEDGQTVKSHIQHFIPDYQSHALTDQELTHFALRCEERRTATLAIIASLFHRQSKRWDSYCYLVDDCSIFLANVSEECSCIILFGASGPTATSIAQSWFQAALDYYKPVSIIYQNCMQNLLNRCMIDWTLTNTTPYCHALAKDSWSLATIERVFIHNNTIPHQYVQPSHLWDHNQDDIDRKLLFHQ